MPTPRLTRTLLAVPALAALAATAATAAGCGNASTAQATPTSGPVAVTLDEWKVAPSATTVKAGAVAFDVTNAGRLPHEMVVLKATTPAARLASDGTPRVKETGRVGEVGELKPGTTGRTTITLAPGHYVLICNLPGHWTAGMRTDLTVR